MTVSGQSPHLLALMVMLAWSSYHFYACLRHVSLLQDDSTPLLLFPPCFPAGHGWLASLGKLGDLHGCGCWCWQGKDEIKTGAVLPPWRGG